MIRKQKKQAGFTLIELLVVVVVIGILASIAIPNFMGAQDKAKNAGVQANVHQVQMEVEQYAVDNSTYPSVLTTNTIFNGTYGKGFPETPWGNLQTSNITGDTSDVQMPLTGFNTYGAGKIEAPAANTDFGAIMYNQNVNDYDITASGKFQGNSVCVQHVKNY